MSDATDDMMFREIGLPNTEFFKRKKRSIPMSNKDTIREALEEIEHTVGCIRRGVYMGLNPELYGREPFPEHLLQGWYDSLLGHDSIKLEKNGTPKGDIAKIRTALNGLYDKATLIEKLEGLKKEILPSLLPFPDDLTSDEHKKRMSDAETNLIMNSVISPHNSALDAAIKLIGEE